MRRQRFIPRETPNKWGAGALAREKPGISAGVFALIVPVLLIHGEEDINILPWHARALAQADPVHAQLWLVPGAGHCGAVGGAPEKFWSRVLNFFARHNSANPGTVTLMVPAKPAGAQPQRSTKTIDKTKAPDHHSEAAGA
jgi:hypothetical protein